MTVGNFLVIVFTDAVRGDADRLFRSGLAIARDIKSHVPTRVVEMAGVRVASFARQNGSGTPIVTDLETGNWLLALGTWFHADGYGVGAEARLLARYLDVGPARLGRELEGFFTVVLGDARTREMIVLTDVVGSCHCFARSWRQAVALSGSALLLAGLEECSLDPIGCQEFLSTGVIYEDRTFYREIRKLGPSSAFRFADGALQSTQRYWQITDLAPESLEGPSAVRALGEALISAANRVGRIFAHPVCDLTGGYDSRAIVAAFLTAGVPFSTVVSGPAESPDVIVSRGLAQLADLPHLHLSPQRQVSFEQVKEALRVTDGQYDLVEYSRILEIHKSLSQCFDISINGSFGEVARGYWWELLFPRIGACSPLNAERLARRRYAAQGCEVSLFPPETRLDLVSHFVGIIERTTAGLSGFPNTVQMDHTYLAMRMQGWQGRIASSTDQLWPCLSLFLFRSVLETMLQTTARLRRRSLLIRRMLAEFQPRLAEFPLEHGYPAVPVTWRTLHRFWPVPKYYGEKVLSKVVHTGGRRWEPRSSQGGLPVRLHLWREEEVREVLRPDTMRMGCLVDRATLGDFLERSRRSDFPFDGQWARVLSLESTLRLLEHTKANLVSSGVLLPEEARRNCL